MTALRALRPIAIADDDPNDVFILRRLMSKAGVPNPLRVFPDGESLVAHLRTCADRKNDVFPPRLVFLDIKMPRLDGFEVLRWIRSQSAWQTLPVVILSGSDEPRDLKRARELGASRYLIKHPPVDVFLALMAEFPEDAASD